MSSEIFEKILNRKIETFKSVFLEDSEGIFKVDGKLFHAQEFGVYRERVLAEIIKSIIPESVQVKDGFVITSKNNLSTQCDIILYNSQNTPVINDGVLRFFPIESVLAIGEVKSVIRTKAELKEILQKLSNQKKLDRDVISLRKEGEMITTFLVCKKLDFDFSTDFDELYENVEPELRHNMILSIEDGIISYQIEREYFSDANKEAFDHVFKGKSKLCEYPLVRGDLMPSVITTSTEEYPNIHIKMFLHTIGSTLEHVRKPRMELQNYYKNEE